MSVETRFHHHLTGLVRPKALLQWRAETIAGIRAHAVEAPVPVKSQGKGRDVQTHVGNQASAAGQRPVHQKRDGVAQD